MKRNIQETFCTTNGLKLEMLIHGPFQFSNQLRSQFFSFLVSKKCLSTIFSDKRSSVSLAKYYTIYLISLRVNFTHILTSMVMGYGGLDAKAIEGLVKKVTMFRWVGRYLARPQSTNECVTNTKSRYSAKISFLKSSAVLYTGSFLLSVNTAQDDVYINRRPKLNWLLACFLCECVCVGRGKNFSEKKNLFF